MHVPFSRLIPLVSLTFLVACGGGTSQPDAGTDSGVAATCTDGIKNGAEADVDCGSSCGPCANGKGCAAGGDCASGICANGACVECETAAQCPGQDSECAIRTCEANTCGVQNTAEGTPVTEQSAGDCKKSVCNGQGQIASVNDDADVHDDANGCTTDACSNGVPSNAPVAAGTACSEGSGLLCDGAGACVGCLSANDCPGADSECASRTCTQGVCGVNFAASGTVLAQQTAGDCQTAACDGQGGVTNLPADLDVANDANGCTTDTCSNGVPTYAPVAAGTACSQGSGLMCDGAGSCVGCITVADCPGADTECSTRTCTQGVCGVNFAVSGTPVAAQTPGDCQTAVCDGQGQVTNIPADLDVTPDSNSCTTDACVNGTPSHLVSPAGTACSENSGSVCNGAGACVACVVGSDCAGPYTECSPAACVNNTCLPSIAPIGTQCSVGGNACDGTGGCQWSVTVVRLGDGAAALSTTSAAVFLEERFLSAGGSVFGTTALPVVANGDHAAFTLSGSASSEGELSRSQDGRYLVMAGYAAVPGTVTVASTSGTVVNRVVARIDSAWGVDTTTKSSTANSGSNVRGATTLDGSSIWISGTGSGTPNPGGAWYIPFGTTTATQVLSSPSNIRWVYIYGGQLYGSAASGTYQNVFSIGSGLPTTGPQTATSFPGMPTATGPQPYGFVMFDRDASIAGVDTLYVADDRVTTSNGGIQKWVRDSAGNWTMAKVLKNGISTGVRGLTGWISGTNVILAATTTESNANKLVFVTDDGSADPAFTVVATAPANTAFRGVALPPVPNPGLNEKDVPGEADFCNIQWPAATTAAVNTQTELIYGQLYEAGLTDTTTGSAAPGVLASLGIGPDGTDPRTAKAWRFTPMTFNTEVGNNDEYKATLTTPAAAGIYKYVVRFSLDNGANWTYCDVNGAGSNPGLTFETAQLGTLTVTP